MTTTLTRVQTREQIRDVVKLAREVWMEHYVSIVGHEQIEYMLGKFQSAEAIATQLATGYELKPLCRATGNKKTKKYGKTNHRVVKCALCKVE